MDRRRFLQAGVAATAATLWPHGAEEVRAQATPQAEDILIAYLTRTGNTKAVAEIIHEEVGGTMVSVKLETPYPENYEKIVSQVARRTNEGMCRPSRRR